MGAFTRATGKITKPTISAVYCTKMEIFTRVNGSMIKLTALVTIFTKMGAFTVASGRMTLKMGEVSSDGQMARSSRATTARA